MRLSGILFALHCFPTSIVFSAEIAPMTPAEAAKKINEKVVVQMAVKSSGGRENKYLNSEEDFKDPKNFTKEKKEVSQR